MFGGAGLAGDFGEADVARIGEASAANGECDDGLIFGGTLEDDGVEILNAAGEIGFAAESVVQFFDALVDCGGAFEVEIVAGFFALEFDGGAEGTAIGVEELDEAIYFGVVFLFGAAGEARARDTFSFRSRGSRGR